MDNQDNVDRPASDAGPCSDLIAKLKSIPPLRFIGGPRDGNAMIWLNPPPARLIVPRRRPIPKRSGSGEIVGDSYRLDPDDPTKTRMLYEGRGELGG
jgi:hypothetical protein